MDEIAKAVATPSPTIFAIREVSEDCKYCLVIEKKVTINEIVSFTRALSIFFAVHYIFNLEYDKSLSEVALFLPRVFVWAASLECQKSSTYLAVSSNVQRFAVA